MTRAQRKNLSIKMKAVYAKKKAGKGQKKLDFEPLLAPGISYAEATMKPQEQTAMDSVRNNEFHYRRGLVTAMECILRELR